MGVTVSHVFEDIFIVLAKMHIVEDGGQEEGPKGLAELPEVAMECMEVWLALPGHPTVYGEVERVGETDDVIDKKYDVVHKRIVEELNHAGI